MRALIIVDVQNDFMPGGALPVPQGDLVVPAINRIAPRYELVVATQDWHPPDHGSFAASHPGRKPGEVIDLHGLPQILWPTHCVQGTPGADFVSGLDVSRVAHVVRKGQDPRVDSYSGFFDNGRRHATGLADYLRQKNIDEVDFVGVATDYCVKFTALDAASCGFRTTLIPDACRGVELRAGDVQAAIDEMRRAGVRIAADMG
jgi:nicotinamidase/pyrazinamidase